MQWLQDLLLKSFHKRAISKLISTTAAIHWFPSILRSGLWNSNIKKWQSTFKSKMVRGNLWNEPQEQTSGVILKLRQQQNTSPWPLLLNLFKKTPMLVISEEQTFIYSLQMPGGESKRSQHMLVLKGRLVRMKGWGHQGCFQQLPKLQHH